MQDRQILLEVSHVSREFPVKRQQLHAVSDVSFTLYRGELLGIVGESGCGKSTLAKRKNWEKEAVIRMRFRCCLRLERIRKPDQIP